MLNNLKERGDVSNDDYNMIIFINDGCAGQFLCGTALYLLLTMLAQRTGKVIYHFVKCAGHGNYRCNTDGGYHKTFCIMAFDKFFTVPEQQVDGKWRAPLHKVEGGLIISLAITVFNILQDDDYVRGKQSHSCWKKKEERHIITERQFILQEFGSAEFLPLKMEAVRFDKGQNMGICAHNFAAGPEIVGYSVMARQIPCLCPGCLQRFQKPVPERYST
jgi:hypothetical protein